MTGSTERNNMLDTVEPRVVNLLNDGFMIILDKRIAVVESRMEGRAYFLTLVDPIEQTTLWMVKGGETTAIWAATIWVTHGRLSSALKRVWEMPREKQG